MQMHLSSYHSVSYGNSLQVIPAPVNALSLRQLECVQTKGENTVLWDATFHVKEHIYLLSGRALAVTDF